MVQYQRTLQLARNTISMVEATKILSLLAEKLIPNVVSKPLWTFLKILNLKSIWAYSKQHVALPCAPAQSNGCNQEIKADFTTAEICESISSFKEQQSLWFRLHPKWILKKTFPTLLIFICNFFQFNSTNWTCPRCMVSWHNNATIWIKKIPWCPKQLPRHNTPRLSRKIIQCFL